MEEDRRICPVRAGPAGPHERHNDVIARNDAGYAHADPLDHASRLVPVDGREMTSPRPAAVDDVAVADRAGDDAHTDLADPRLAQVDFLNAKRLVEGVTDGGPDAS